MTPGGSEAGAKARLGNRRRSNRSQDTSHESGTADALPFVDLAAQSRRLGDRIGSAIARVLEHGQFVMGPEVAELEERLAARCEVRHCITCSSGTDALVMALLARGVGAGDAVVVPSFTFAATAEAVALVGAVPVLADVDSSTFNLRPEDAEAGVRAAKLAGLHPRGVIAVDLFGQPADYAGLGDVAGDHDLWLLADAAQSYGADIEGIAVGRLADVTTTSFFPAKPLGCYGDGGAVFTDDDGLAERLRSIRIHGQGSNKYQSVVIGMNGRLDTLQAAVLLAKLEVFDEELEARQEVATRYTELLPTGAEAPVVAAGRRSTWAQYTVRVPAAGGQAGLRDQVTESLRVAGIPTAIYYPTPVHCQPAYQSFPVGGPSESPGSLSTSEWLSGCVLSLPMHPYLSLSDQDRVLEELGRALD